jgi:hypothetical protein
LNDLVVNFHDFSLFGLDAGEDFIKLLVGFWLNDLNLLE